MSSLIATVAASTPFLQIVLIVLFVFIFRKEISLAFFGRGADDPNRELFDKIDSLTQYFNHETTDALDEIKQGVLIVKTDVQRLQAKHEEWDKYGIPTREKKII